MMNMAEKLSIGGLKFSGDLAQVVMTDAHRDAGGRVLLQSLSEQQINITLLTWMTDDPSVTMSCCIAMKDAPKVEKLARLDTRLTGRLAFHRHLGTIALFPHRARMTLLGRALAAFHDAGIPIFAMASSISTLTFVTYCRLLEAAATALEPWLILPEYHTPFIPEFCVRQVSFSK